jgi:hypothetical protein
MMKFWTVILGAALTGALLSITPAWAAILYVDKDNSCPGSGTSTSPYCSIANAVATVNAGDTIRIRNAATPYSETVQTTRTGTSTARITIEPDVGHSPTLRNAGNNGQCATLWIRDADYWTIRDLNFDATNVNSCVFGAIHIHAVSRNAVGNQILNNTFRGWGFLSSDVASYPAAVVVNGGALGPTQGFWPTGTLINGNTFSGNRLAAIALLHTQDTVIEENEITSQQCGRDSDTAVNTLGVKATYHNRGLLVRANNIHDFQPSAGQSGGCMLPNQAWPTIAGYWCDVGGTNTTIEGNRIRNLNQHKSDQSNPTGNNIASMGIFVEAGCESHTVRNNVVHDIGNFGIRNDYHSFNSAQIPNRYYNNTIYNAHRSAV